VITMKNRAVICVVLIVTALILAGCLGTKTLPVPNTADPTLFVDYQRSGGIAGINDRLVVFDNGAALVSSRTTSREIQLNQSELEQISQVFAAAQFTALEGNYTSLRGGADFMQYSISYKGKTVNTEDTAIPPALEPVIEEMNRILSNGMSSGQGDLSLPRIRL
jgi:hypothetical protein